MSDVYDDDDDDDDADDDDDSDYDEDDTFLISIFEPKPLAYISTAMPLLNKINTQWAAFKYLNVIMIRK